MNWREKRKRDNLSEEEWKIVEERLKTMPEKLRLGILSKSYTRDELLIEIQNKTPVGQSYVEMQMEFVRWLVKQSKFIQS